MRILLPNIDFWRHVMCECHYNCAGTVLLHNGQNPALVLGACWDFYYPPGDARPEEYYCPCRWPSLIGSLCPYHPVASQWHDPIDAEQGWLEVRECLQRGNPVLLAVDNYYLPFRPAYKDVHTNHLIVLYGFDEEANEVYVLDASPPSFKGAIRIDELRDARSSENPAAHDRDLFFTNVPIANRWLDVQITDKFPLLTREWVKGVIDTNITRFRTPMDGPIYSGTEGLNRFFGEASLSEISETGSSGMDELVLVCEAFRSSAGVHADFLKTAGHRLDWDRLAEIGCEVERLALDCAPIRITAARGRSHPETELPRLQRRFARLLSDHEQVLRDLELVIKNV